MGTALEVGVVGVADHRAVAGLAAQDEVVLRLDVNDFVVAAIVDGDERGVGVARGHGINGALHGHEIAGAIGGHQDVGGIGRAGHLGGELPGIGGGDAGEVGPGGVGERAVIHGHIIGLVGGQHAAMRIDGGRVAGDDDRIVGEVVAADGARLNVFRIGIGGHAQGEVDGVHRGGAVGDVIDFDGAGVLQHGGGTEGEIQRGVVADAGGGIGG